MNIKTIIRLNKPKYNKEIFTEAGFKHFDLFFPDGTLPSQTIINSFFEIIENERDGIAIHCKAGLGRTGTLIALYLMRHYKLCASDVIAWLRILRPGSILGQQQHFLLKYQEVCFNMNSDIYSGFNEEKKSITNLFINSLRKKKSIKFLKNFGFKEQKGQGEFLITQKIKQ